MMRVFGDAQLSETSRAQIVSLFEAGHDLPSIHRQLQSLPPLIIRQAIAEHLHEMKQGASLAAGSGRRCQEIPLPGGRSFPPIDKEEGLP